MWSIVQKPSLYAIAYFLASSFSKHSSSYFLHPGDGRCFLFSLKPKLALYLASGANDNFQYLNVGVETLPNGLVSCSTKEGDEGWLKRESFLAPYLRREWAASFATLASFLPM